MKKKDGKRDDGFVYSKWILISWMRFAETTLELINSSHKTNWISGRNDEVLSAPTKGLSFGSMDGKDPKMRKERKGFVLISSCCLLGKKKEETYIDRQTQ